ncbi:hypothetical protein BE17_52995 [Sorangium cellulosum]|uniref:Uncharacterized protein n=1 Tax=Sorangium cellulosum TaxID=56 RepID=A0A150RWA2_SORCE|nr:hypothetical protein BE17_52995 [Sorangium cellulosum]
MILLLETRCMFATHESLRASHAEWAWSLLACEGCEPERTIEYIHDAIRRYLRQSAALGEREMSHA